MDLYFKRHDGHAVTCDDFLAAMADANGVDLATLSNWYSQAGTPRVTVEGSYNAGACAPVRHAAELRWRGARPAAAQDPCALSRLGPLAGCTLCVTSVVECAVRVRAAGCGPTAQRPRRTR